ncbi:MAG: N-acetyltransferase [Bacilli bacterium]|nr:N-acetyltransferase [Bacilli bacterium]
MEVRLATLDDLEEIKNCFTVAKKKMVGDGNIHQWEKIDYPFCFTIEDINKKQCYVITNNNEIVATFVLIKGQDPTYSYIEDGAWLNNEDYVTIHRIASNNKAQDIFTTAINFAKSFGVDIRIDTHKDNKRMLHLIEKAGFIYTGIIYVRDGTPRNAYQLKKGL